MGLMGLIDEHGIAHDGNGNDEEISEEQFALICQLHKNVKEYREKLSDNYCDHEMCRRYLVARQWDLKKAEDQLISTLRWRNDENLSKKLFWQSRKTLTNPHALCMRCVGWDSEGRLIIYVCYAEGLDRFDHEANGDYLIGLLEDMDKVMLKRRERGLNKSARTRQKILVCDFDGFSTRDMNPKSAIITARLLQHYPETVNSVLLLDAPYLFGGLFRIVAPMLDDRVRSKVAFVNGAQKEKTLREKLGDSAAQWIMDEMKDNQERRPQHKLGNPKKYWIPPTEEGKHDPRGMEEYVKSDLYIKTPGDAFEENKLES